MNLETQRLFLRPIQSHDAPDMFVARGDTEVMRYWDWPAQNTVEQVRGTIQNHFDEIERGTVNWWVAALTPRGPAIGECDLSDVDLRHKRAEVGFLFRREVWGQGYAREAMERIIAFAFKELELERLWARCHSGNEPSKRLLEKLDFVREGTLHGHVLREGERRDCILYGRMRP